MCLHYPEMKETGSEYLWKDYVDPGIHASSIQCSTVACS